MTCSSSCPLYENRCAPVNPDFAIEGDPQSRFWIVGLNPKIDSGCMNWEQWRNRTQGWSNIPYFKNLEKVLGVDALGDDRVKRLGLPVAANGIAHTDIVKCGTPNFNSDVKGAIKFCSDHLFAQIDMYLPQVIFCNGVEVSHFMIKRLGALPTFDPTIWYAIRKGQVIYFIFTGFVTRLDRWTQARILKDVNTVCLPLGL